MDYVYDCKGREIKLEDTDKTKVLHEKYFVVFCDKCCNKTVVHLLRRSGGNVRHFSDDF